MQQVLVRIEYAETGKGPFQADRKTDGWYSYIKRHRNMQTPYGDDILKGIKPDERCAYKSFVELLRWVTKHELNIMVKEGLRVVRYIVNACRVGQDQALFKECDVIERQDITDFALEKVEDFEE